MRALISTYDKTGLDVFARGLADLGWELVASGGTASYLEELGLTDRLHETGRNPQRAAASPVFMRRRILAAIVDPRGPRLGRAIVTNASATASTQRTEGSRAVHSLRCPKSLNDAATSQLTSGGLRK